MWVWINSNSHGIKYLLIECLKIKRDASGLWMIRHSKAHSKFYHLLIFVRFRSGWSECKKQLFGMEKEMCWKNRKNHIFSFPIRALVCVFLNKNVFHTLSTFLLSRFELAVVVIDALISTTILISYFDRKWNICVIFQVASSSR
jgi:hypothetical protein